MAGKKNVRAKPKKAREVCLSLCGAFQQVLYMPITKAQFDLIANPNDKQKDAASALWDELQERVSCDGTGYTGFIPGKPELHVAGKRHDAGTAKLDADISKQVRQLKPGPMKAKRGYFIIQEAAGIQNETLEIKGEFALDKLSPGLILEALPDGSLAPMVSCSYDGRDFELDNGHSQSETYLFNSATGRVDPCIELD